mmetsp:Transcript_132947/g.425199  ORF Transcript_132947/g.425199 Transcript_132947/m.425199 type:complete len:346 (-) Transcript_132947:3655-4692(-)
MFWDSGKSSRGSSSALSIKTKPIARIWTSASCRPLLARDSRARRVCASRPWLLRLLVPLTSCSFICSWSLLTVFSTCLKTLALGFRSPSSASMRSFSTCIVIVSSWRATLCAWESMRCCLSTFSATWESASCLSRSACTSLSNLSTASCAKLEASLPCLQAPASSVRKVLRDDSRKPQAWFSAATTATVSAFVSSRSACSLAASLMSPLPLRISASRRRNSIFKLLFITSSGFGTPPGRLPRLATVMTHEVFMSDATSPQASLTERRPSRLSSGPSARPISASQPAAPSSATCVSKTARSRSLARARARAAAARLRSSMAARLLWAGFSSSGASAARASACACLR